MIIRAKAPLRISFAGGGTDVSPYPEEKGGCVLNATIDLFAYATLYPLESSKINIHSIDYNTSIEYRIDEEFKYDGKFDLIKGAIKHFFPFKRKGFKLFLHSDAPPGSGLGSSSTLMVALIGVFKEWLNLPIFNYEIAELAYKIEREDIGIKGGKQDQYAATFGGVNFIEFTMGKSIVHPLKIPNNVLNELEYRLVLAYTGSTRLSSKIIEKQVKGYIERKDNTLKAMDTQKALAIKMKEALLLGELDEFGKLVHKAWEAKKNMANGITNKKIDQIYESALKSGAIGGKISGAGGGGFMFFVCAPFSKRKVIETLLKLKCSIINFHFEKYGLQTWRI